MKEKINQRYINFVPDQIPWMHIDMMAWSLRPRPGHPVGGEAMAIRALYTYLKRRFKST